MAEGDPAELADVNVAGLRDMLEARGLSTEGKRAELIARLVRANRPVVATCIRRTRLTRRRVRGSPIQTVDRRPQPDPSLQVIPGRELAGDFWEGWSQPVAYAKTATVLAIQLVQGALVRTPEGDMTAAAGDYLVSDDPPTHAWPVAQEVFERTYAPVEPEIIDDAALAARLAGQPEASPATDEEAAPGA